MNKLVVAPLAAAMMALAGTAGAAEKSTTFQVSAVVTTNCVISAGAMDLGVFDGSNNLTASSSITVSCTNGTPYFVNLSTGGSGSYAARRLTNGVSNLFYNLYTSNTYGTVWGDGSTASTGNVGGSGDGMASVDTLTVHGRLLASDNTGAIDAGTYTDTITATIVY